LKTYSAKASELTDSWYLVDAEGQTLGRLATGIARVLRGKHKPTWTPHLNCGDHVVVVNAAKIQVSGRRADLKTYERYSGYPGGRRTRTYAEAAARNPTYPLYEAVRGMLQHNTLGELQLKRLRIFPAAQHPHAAQKPQPVKLTPQGGLEPVDRA
jgi:large subunit ribosomal protein L13